MQPPVSAVPASPSLPSPPLDGARLYPALTEAQRAAFCPSAPWWTAPVIIGGSGGSGTRGSVLLMQRLGVAIACEDPSMLDEVIIGEGHCNSARDFGLLSGEMTRPPPLVWLADGPDISTCTASDDQMASLLGLVDQGDQGALSVKYADAVPQNVINGRCLKRENCSVAQRLLDLRSAVRPQFRKPLRWGMKNPHFTYMQKWLLRAFPCLVYVHTMRDMDEMIREAEHWPHRVNEAELFGMRPDGHDLPSASRDNSHSPEGQAWLKAFLLQENDGLTRWASRCMPAQIIYLPVMRLARCISLACEAYHATRLARMLRLEPSATFAKVQEYTQASHAIVVEARKQASKKPLWANRNGELVEWPSKLLGLCGWAFCSCGNSTA